MELQAALSSLREHVGDIGQWTRSLMVAVCLATATAACGPIPQRSSSILESAHASPKWGRQTILTQEQWRCYATTIVIDRSGRIVDSDKKLVGCERLYRNRRSHYSY